MYCILFDEETKSVSFYKDLELQFALNQRDYFIHNKEDISYFSMLDMALSKLKQKLSFDIIDLKREEDSKYLQSIEKKIKEDLLIRGTYENKKKIKNKNYNCFNAK